MRTLRDEVITEREVGRAAIPRSYEIACGRVMEKYGSYRVVEGAVSVWRSFKDDRVVVSVDDVEILDSRRDLTLHILLPPEEPREGELERQMRERIGELECEIIQVGGDYENMAAERNEYEKVLRDIADVRTEPLGVAQEMKRKAREALDENDDPD